jgi:hypothetical protein
MSASEGKLDALASLLRLRGFARGSHLLGALSETRHELGCEVRVPGETASKRKCRHLGLFGSMTWSWFVQFPGLALYPAEQRSPGRSAASRAP